MMNELDLLKKDWNKQTKPFPQLQESDIAAMIHKRSSSIVKWILIISILEVTLWTAISLFFNTDEVMVKNHTEYMIPYFKIITYVNYAVVAAFIYAFYVNYKNISTLRSTKKLMQDILKTRRTVKYYVWYNLIMIGLSAIAGFVLAFVANPQMQKISHNPKAMVITIIILVVFLLAFFGIAALIYYLIYGTLMKRLFRNYNELKKIDL
ncbi:MAG: hypothetical protein ACK5RV_10460 [Flavobacterium sp.]|jgi:hypothetical protein|uniref:hypothetical protein n=1 Tax=Flavobacterium sp. TaxID=239 RepID=UPI00338FEAB3